MSPISDKFRLAPCNRCLRQTNHNVLWKDVRPWEDVIDEDMGHSISGSESYFVLECAGCNEVRLLHSYWFSEDTDFEGRPTSYSDYYPPTVSRQKPIWRKSKLTNWTVEEELNPLFDEVYTAHAAGAFTIAVMGIRALTEKIMVEQVGDQGTFAATVDKFFSAGFVAPVQQERFKNVLIEAGHAAMHRNFKPSMDDVETLLGLVENLVNIIYYEPSRTNKVKEKIPAKIKKQQQ
jgi:hypothetical protein